jgi:hypothetical protein
VSVLLALQDDAPPPVSGSGGVTFSAPALAGTGAETFTGTGSVTFARPSLAAVGVETFTGTGAVVFARPALAGIGVEAFIGSGSVTFAAPALAGTGAEMLSGTGEVVFAALALAGTGEVTAEGDVTGSGGVVFVVPALAGTGDVATVPVVPPVPSGGGGGGWGWGIYRRARHPVIPAPAVTGVGGVAFAGPSVAGHGSVTPRQNRPGGFVTPALVPSPAPLLVPVAVTAPADRFAALRAAEELYWSLDPAASDEWAAVFGR